MSLTCDETGDTEGSSAAALGVPLLEAGHVPGDVLQGHGVLHGQLVTLTLHPRLLDQHPGVGCESGEGHQDVVIQRADLPHSPVLLQLGNCLLLNT